MRDELPDWLDAAPDEPDASSTSPRRWVLRLAAIVPWAVVIVLILLGRWSGEAATGHVVAGDTGADEPTSPATEGTTTSPDTEVLGIRRQAGRSDGGPAGDDQDDAAPARTGDVAIATELRGAWRVGPDEGDAAAVAVAVARAWLTGIDPRAAIHGITPVSEHTYLEHAVVEAVERTGPDTAVVTLLAVLLDRDGDRTEVRTGRLSVPIAFVDDGVRPAGTPWWAATPDLRPAVPTSEPVDDHDVRLAAVDALVHAGFSEVDLRALGRTETGPVIATVRGRAPDGSAMDGDVWLRPHLDGFVVAGATLQPVTSTHRTEDAA